MIIKLDIEKQPNLITMREITSNTLLEEIGKSLIHNFGGIPSRHPNSPSERSSMILLIHGIININNKLVKDIIISCLPALNLKEIKNDNDDDDIIVLKERGNIIFSILPATSSLMVNVNLQ